MTKCIWYISKYFPPPSENNSGGRSFLLMKEIKKLGYEVVVMTSDSNHLSEVPLIKGKNLCTYAEELRICWLKVIKYKKAKSFLRMISWLDFERRLFFISKRKFNNPDVIIVSSLSLLTIINGLILRQKYKCRLIFEVRDIWPLTLVEEGGYKKWNPLILILGLIEKIGYSYSDAIVGTMPNLGEHVAKILGKSKNTYCIPMGIPERTLVETQSVNEDYIQKYLNHDKFVVMYAGTIGITNALQTFFNCAEIMNDPNIHFIVVGQGDLTKNYKEKYSHLGNLTFAPHVPKSMVKSVLKQADLLYFSVHKSKVWDYGQSLNKVIDYMLSEKPILASYTGFKSMIDESACGSFVEADDVVALKNEISRMSKLSGKDLKKIGERGKSWLLANRRYTKLAKEYERIFLQEK